MILMRVLLTLLGLCPHPHSRRERDSKGYWFVCESCGKRVPAIQRTAAELKAQRAKLPKVAKAQRADKAPGQIVAMGRRPKA